MSLEGGYTDWKRNGYEIEIPKSLSPERRARYSRHLLIPEIGEEGQLKLLESQVLLIGAGGLGSPASLYLAAAGIGQLGIIDSDVVDATNLQRQIPHTLEHARLAESGLARSARSTRSTPTSRLHVSRAPDLGEHRPDPRRRLGHDRRRRRQLPDPLPRQRRVGLARDPRRARIDLSLRGPGDGLQAARRSVLPLPLPQPPPPELAPSCAEGGVLGVLPGIVGSLQTNEAIKLAARDRRAADRPAPAASTRSRPSSPR